MTWQPIETAPKDGSEVDFWCHNADDERRGHHRICGYVWDTTYKCFRKPEDLHFINSPGDHLTLTHWMLAATQPSDFAHIAKLWDRYSSARPSLRRWRKNHFAQKRAEILANELNGTAPR